MPGIDPILPWDLVNWYWSPVLLLLNLYRNLMALMAYGNFPARILHFCILHSSFCMVRIRVHPYCNDEESRMADKIL